MLCCAPIARSSATARARCAECAAAAPCLIWGEFWAEVSERSERWCCLRKKERPAGGLRSSSTVMLCDIYNRGDRIERSARRNPEVRLHLINCSGKDAVGNRSPLSKCARSAWPKRVPRYLLGKSSQRLKPGTFGGLRARLKSCPDARSWQVVGRLAKPANAI